MPPAAQLLTGGLGLVVTEARVRNITEIYVGVLSTRTSSRCRRSRRDRVFKQAKVQAAQFASRGTRTAIIATRPAASTTHSPPIPARSVPKKSMKVKNIHGARNDTARPVVV
jgi:hypothetical protein